MVKIENIKIRKKVKKKIKGGSSSHSSSSTMRQIGKGTFGFIYLDNDNLIWKLQFVKDEETFDNDLLKEFKMQKEVYSFFPYSTPEVIEESFKDIVNVEEGSYEKDPKFLLFESSTKEEFRKNFQEAKITSTKIQYFAMRYIRGNDYKSLCIDPPDIDKKKCKERENKFCKLIKKIHEKNIIHNDLHEENVIFDENDNPKIIDWGLSKNSINGWGGEEPKGSWECGDDKYFPPETFIKIDNNLSEITISLKLFHNKQVVNQKKFREKKQLLIPIKRDIMQKIKEIRNLNESYFSIFKSVKNADSKEKEVEEKKE